jgi:hypothetical protein
MHINISESQLFEKVGYLEKTLSVSNRKADDIYSISLLQPLLNGYPFLPFTGASLRPFCLVHILNDIVINGRKSIIEFGSGLSTIMMGRLVKKNNLNVTVFSVEHDKEWAKVMEGILDNEGLTEIVTVACIPLKEWELQGSKYNWYDIELLSHSIEARQFDMVLIDGPPAWEKGKEMARYPALPFIREKLSAEHSIYLDDADRPGEQYVLEMWKQRYAVDFNITNGTFACHFSGNAFHTSP